VYALVCLGIVAKPCGHFISKETCIIFISFNFVFINQKNVNLTLEPVTSHLCHLSTLSVMTSSIIVLVAKV